MRAVGSLGEIVFWRLIQGAGGAALISTAQSTIVEIFPRSQIATVQSIFGLGLIVTPTLGPLLGGYITDNYSWRTIFFIHVPLGIASLTLVGLFLQDSLHQKRVNTVNVWGILMLAAGMGSLQYVLEEGERYDWFSDPTIARLAVVAAVALVDFVWWELSPRNKAPIPDLRVLRDRGLAASVILGLVLGFGLYGGVFIYPLFVQTILGFTPTETGLALLPGGIMTAVAVIFCGRVLQRGFDARILIITGMFIYMSGRLQRRRCPGGGPAPAGPRRPGASDDNGLQQCLYSAGADVPPGPARRAAAVQAQARRGSTRRSALGGPPARNNGGVGKGLRRVFSGSPIIGGWGASIGGRGLTPAPPLKRRRSAGSPAPARRPRRTGSPAASLAKALEPGRR